MFILAIQIQCLFKVELIVLFMNFDIACFLAEQIYSKMIAFKNNQHASCN